MLDGLKPDAQQKARALRRALREVVQALPRHLDASGRGVELLSGCLCARCIAVRALGGV